MVSWGPNTTFNYGGPSPAPATGTPGGPPPVPAFGSTPAPLAALPSFGATPAPAAGSTFGLFGASTAPNPAPAPAFGSSGLFGTAPATPSPAGTTSGLFGTASAGPFGSTTSLFGGSSTTPTAFGSSLPAQSTFGAFGLPQQHQQIPAQAAIQAHMNASALQEEQRLRVQFEKLHRTYTGTLEIPGDSQETSKFVAIVYNELSPEQIQQRFFSGIGNTGQILAPQRPIQVSEKEWIEAIINNPDPSKYTPQPIIGAVALQSRVIWQQDRAKEYAIHAKAVQTNLDFIRRREARAKQDLHEKEVKYLALQQKLLQVMTKVELARCFNKSLQPDEYRALQRLMALLHQVEGMRVELASLQSKAQSHIAAIAHRGAHRDMGPPNGMSKEMKEELLRVLKEQRQKLERTTKMVKKDLTDMELIQERVVATVPVVIH